MVYHATRGSVKDASWGSGDGPGMPRWIAWNGLGALSQSRQERLKRTRHATHGSAPKKVLLKHKHPESGLGPD